ncbi:MAG: adenylate/guanylate cyclase domain-containing protein [Bacteroidia bacterium]
MKRYYWIPLLIFSGFFAKGQTIEWTGKKQSILIGQQISILHDSSEKLTFSQVSSALYASKFVVSDKKVLDFKTSHSIYWIKFSISNSNGENVLLEVAQSLLPNADLYYKDTSGVLHIYKAGYTVNLNSKTIRHNLQLFPLGKSNIDCYLRIRTNGTPIPITIWNTSVYETKITNQKITYGIYMGIMLFVILINLFLFVSLRRFAYLHYTFLVFLYATFSAMIDGYMTYIFPGMDLMYWYVLNPILNQPNGLLYCLVFLEVRKYAPGINKFAIGVVLYFISYIFWYPFIPLSTVLAISQFHALLGISLMVTIAIRAGRKGNKLGYYFAIAYFIFFVIAAIEIIYLQTGSPAHLFDISHVSVAIFIEVFLLAYLLSKRFEWEKNALEESKTEAQYKLIAQTQENERIVREQNVILEQKVEERTHQLKETNEELSHTLKVVEKERQKSEALLHNILPEEVALELKEFGKSDARLFNEVTVMFTDFVNFTSISEKLTPEELVHELDFCFQKFDEIITTHDLEKIKTIGDAYLAVGGLPLPHKHHAHLVVKAAKEICDFMKWYEARRRKDNLPHFEVRVGVHSGPVVAGIVGVKKFAYDIWGDTVNTASRMESSSEPGRINISGATYELVKNEIKCQHRGKIEAKNKGMIDMYFVE